VNKINASGIERVSKKMVILLYILIPFAMSNLFLTAIQQYNTYTENGAVSHGTTGDALVDYFAKCATYRNRPEVMVYADLSRIWAEAPKITLQIMLYLRLITRKPKGFFASEKVQMGQGNRSEFRTGIKWLATYQPDVFYKNLWLLPVAGCWKDLWHKDLLQVLNTARVYALIEQGLADDYNRQLLAKYLPRIRSKKHLQTERHKDLNRFAYGLCRHLKWTPQQYRKFKAGGTAHVFQRQMCANLWNEINFEAISGKALFNLVNHVGRDGLTTLARHQQEERYLNWIKQQPIAKFTGYVYELMNAVQPQMGLAQRYTLDKQFEGLLDLARQNAGGITENVWCALDTSGSMQAPVANTTAFKICVSLGIYFASLNQGVFKDHVVMFDATSKVMKLSGTFTDKALQIMAAETAWGNTNFQSVIDEIVRVRTQNPQIPVSDFPTTLLVISDLQFDPATEQNTETNYEALMRKLTDAGLPKIRVIWWWVTGRREDFPSTIQDEGVSMLGGFDAAILSLLLGGQTHVTDAQTGKTRQLNAYENMLKALDQELLRQVKIN